MLYTFNPCLLLNTPSLLVHTTHSQSTLTTLTCSGGVSLELSQPIKTSFTNLQQFGKHLRSEEWPKTYNMHYNAQTQMMLNAFICSHRKKIIDNYLMISCYMPIFYETKSENCFTYLITYLRWHLFSLGFKP